MEPLDLRPFLGVMRVAKHAHLLHKAWTDGREKNLPCNKNRGFLPQREAAYESARMMGWLWTGTVTETVAGHA